MISLRAKRSGDDASNPSGLLPRENERGRNGVTRNSDGMHAEAERELILPSSLSFFFFFFFDLRARCREDDPSRLKGSPLSPRETHTGLAPPHLFSMLNASVRF